MKLHKEVNKAIDDILGGEKLYDLRREFRVIRSDLTYNDAVMQLDNVPTEEAHLYSITSTIPDNYCEDVSLALYAARRIAERNQCTFVLSLESGVWKAAYGNWGDCAEYVGSNPAYATCVSVLKYMGKL